MESLQQILETLAKEIYVEKRRHYAFTGKCILKKEDATQCWICEEPFGKFEGKSSTIATTLINFWVGPTIDVTSILKQQISHPWLHITYQNMILIPLFDH